MSNDQAFDLLTQAAAVMPTNKWSDRELIATAVQTIRAALAERQALLDSNKTPVAVSPKP